MVTLKDAAFLVFSSALCLVGFVFVLSSVINEIG